MAGEWPYERFGVIGIVAMLVHVGAPAFSAACSGGSLAPQCTAPAASLAFSASFVLYQMLLLAIVEHCLRARW